VKIKQDNKVTSGTLAKFFAGMGLRPEIRIRKHIPEYYRALAYVTMINNESADSLSTNQELAAHVGATYALKNFSASNQLGREQQASFTAANSTSHRGTQSPFVLSKVVDTAIFT
jgi:hypothetical protein